jgi:uncharacterized membrane protein
MNLVFDPIWPWSYLWSLAPATEAPGAAAVLRVAVVVFWLSILFAVLGPRKGNRRLKQGAFLGLLLLTAWYVLSHGGSGLLRMRDLLVGIALSTLIVVPLALAGLTIWAYLSAPGATRRRVTVVGGLRLAAFLMALIAVLRPSLAFSDKNRLQSVLYVVLDASESMTILDELDNNSRWDYLLKNVTAASDVMNKLRDDHKIDVVFYRFAGDTVEILPDEPGKADGKRTDFGTMLRTLYDGRDGTRLLRGLLIFSDGADNGTRIPALAEAAKWRSLPCPVHTFAYGKPTTSDRQADVAVRKLTIEPSTVRVKGDLIVKAIVDAPGFEGRRMRVRVFIDGEEVVARNEVLPLTTDNEVTVKCLAPTKPGEVKVTVHVGDPNPRSGKPEPPQGDTNPKNNEASTFVNVSKEGISVLLVDKQRTLEPQAIYDVLTADPRIQVKPVWMRGDQPIDPNAADLFEFDKRQYDVVILGDVTARQVKAVNPQALAAIEKLVENGAGFLMIGGYASFGNGDWQGTEIARLLPVELVASGQEEGQVKMVPTPDGLRRYRYVVGIQDGKDDDVREAWQKLPALKGMTRLGTPKPGLATVLAETEDKHLPLLVTQNYGSKSGRTLAFGADTTHFSWVRSDEGRRWHGRFWRQMIVWLAKQEDAGGSVWVRPETRHLPLHTDLSFAVGLRSKGGVDITNGSYKVEVYGPGPDGSRTEVTTVRTATEDRGTFGRTDLPGEYRLEVSGKGVGPDGEEVTGGPLSARFIVYDEDVELTRRSADHDFLRKLAAAGGGQFHRPEELNRFLEQLADQPTAHGRLKMDLWPNWRGTARSGFLVSFFLVFVALLSVEWGLRRRWGMV